MIKDIKTTENICFGSRKLFCIRLDLNLIFSFRIIGVRNRVVIRCIRRLVRKSQGGVCRILKTGLCVTDSQRQPARSGMHSTQPKWHSTRSERLPLKSRMRLGVLERCFAV